MMIGIPVIVLTGIVGTSAFVTLQQSTEISTGLKIAVGGISILAAILSSLQTFFKFGEKAGKHKTASVAFAELRKDVEQVSTFGHDGNLEQFMADVNARWGAASKEAPDLPPDLVERARSAARKDLDGTESWTETTCTGRLEDTYVFRTGMDGEPISDNRRWRYTLGSVHLERSSKGIRLNGGVQATLPNEEARRYDLVAEGSVKSKSAHLVYTFLDASGEVCWHGVMALRIPPEGDIHGFWLTTEVTDIDTSFIMGRIVLTPERMAVPESAAMPRMLSEDG